MKPLEGEARPGEDRSDLTAALGVDVPAELLELALTHRSYAYEHPPVAHNERLEFLGDSVLGLAVTEELYVQHPDLSEGELAKVRSSVVNARALADVARGLPCEGGLGRWILLGRGETTSGGRDKHSILADTMEAVLGAVHLAHGVRTSQELVLRLFGPVITANLADGAATDFKTAVQEEAGTRGWGLPFYDVEGTGPDHQRVFTARLVLDGRVWGEGTGTSKKEAEQLAARRAHDALKEPAADPDGEPGTA